MPRTEISIDIEKYFLDKGWTIQSKLLEYGGTKKYSTWHCTITTPDKRIIEYEDYTTGTASLMFKYKVPVSPHITDTMYGFIYEHLKSSNSDAEFRKALARSYENKEPIPYYIIQIINKLNLNNEHSKELFDAFNKLFVPLEPTIDAVLFDLASGAEDGAMTFNEFCHTYEHDCTAREILGRYFKCQDILEKLRGALVDHEELLEIFREYGY